MYLKLVTQPVIHFWNLVTTAICLIVVVQRRSNISFLSERWLKAPRITSPISQGKQFCLSLHSKIILSVILSIKSQTRTVFLPWMPSPITRCLVWEKKTWTHSIWVSSWHYQTWKPRTFSVQLWITTVQTKLQPRGK